MSQYLTDRIFRSVVRCEQLTEAHSRANDLAQVMTAGEWTDLQMTGFAEQQIPGGRFMDDDALQSCAEQEIFPLMEETIRQVFKRHTLSRLFSAVNRTGMLFSDKAISPEKLRRDEGFYNNLANTSFDTATNMIDVFEALTGPSTLGRELEQRRDASLAPKIARLTSGIATRTQAEALQTRYYLNMAATFLNEAENDLHRCNLTTAAVYFQTASMPDRTEIMTYNGKGNEITLYGALQNLTIGNNFLSYAQVSNPEWDKHQPKKRDLSALPPIATPSPGLLN